jgi:hypothetical protein
MHDIQDSFSASSASDPKKSPFPVPNPSKSFWHVNPVLQNHRTTPTLPSHVEYLIVGSGLTGASALRYLVDAEVAGPILMLEAREACWGATGRVSSRVLPCDICSRQNPYQAVKSLPSKMSFDQTSRISF